MTVYTETTYHVIGYGEVEGLGYPVTYPDYPQEHASFTIKVAGATRTQGFWQTHLAFTSTVFETYAGSHIDLGWKNITTINQLMGIFWANVAKKSDGKKRTALDQARMIASQQAIAAILNSSMPGGSPLPSGFTLDVIRTTLAGTDINAIKSLGSLLATYNESGDSFALDPSLPPTGRATPKAARDIADIPFAD